jgi:hypothetical protein
MAPRCSEHPGTWPTEEMQTVDTQSIRTDYAEVIPDETPHGYYEGWQFVGYFVEDENGEHVEEIE